MSSTPTSPTSPSTPGCEYLFRVPQSYAPRHEGEIALTCGDVIADVKDLGNGWTLGRNVTRDTIGIFPSKYIRPMSDVRGPPHEQVVSQSVQPRPVANKDGQPPQAHATAVRPRQANKPKPPPRRSNDDRDRAQNAGGDPSILAGRPTAAAPGVSRPSGSGNQEKAGSRLPVATNLVAPCVLGLNSPDSVVSPGSEPLRGPLSSESEADLTPSDVEYNSLPTPKHGRFTPAKKPHMVVKPSHQGKGGPKKPEARMEPILQESLQDYPPPPPPMHAMTLPMAAATAMPAHNYANPSKARPGQLNLQGIAGPEHAGNVTDMEKSYDLDGEPQRANTLQPSYHVTRDRSTSPMVPSDGMTVSPNTHSAILANSAEIELDNATNETIQNSPQMTPKERDNKNKPYYRDYRTLECPSLLDGAYPRQTARFKPMLKNRHQKVADSKGQHIYYREPHDKNKSSRLILSIIAGVLIAFIEFLWMYYYLEYGFMIAVGVCATTALVLIILFALSRMVRCVGALMLPSICTTRGRIGFIVLITGFLFGGPVTNIYYNMEEISRSMSCSADQTYNQTLLLLRPFDEMMRHLNTTIVQLQSAAYQVSIGLRPLDEGLDKVEMDLYNGKIQLHGTRRTCTTMVNRAYNSCATGLLEAQDQCLTVMVALGTVYHQARDVLDRFNPERWAAKHTSLLLKKRQVLLGTGQPGEEDGAGLGPEANRDICESLDTIAVCQILNDSSTLCKPSGWAGEAIQEAINGTQQAMHSLQSTLQFQVMAEPYIRARESESEYEVQKIVTAEFAARTAHFELVVRILMKLVPIAVLLIIYVSYHHVKHYLASDTYDNTYITKHFKHLDQKRAEVAGDSLLPLKRYERNYLIDTTLSDLSPPEDGLYRIGMCVATLHMLLSFSCYMFDYILFWILALIQRHAKPISDFTGQDSLNDAVNGEGVIVELLQIFLRRFNAGSWYGFKSNAHTCLPSPSAPSIIYLLVIFAMYFVLILAILLKAYILRLRNSLTGYFYPERRKARTVHLYNVILNQRSRMPKLLHQRARLNHRERHIEEQVSFCHKVARRCPPCRIFLYKSSRCLVCNSVEDQSFRDCETEKCFGVYCADCFDDLGRICPLCLHGMDYSDDDDYEDFDDDLQPYQRSSKIYL